MGLLTVNRWGKCEVCGQIVRECKRETCSIAKAKDEEWRTLEDGEERVDGAPRPPWAKSIS
jgi:hypothetical protein